MNDEVKNKNNAKRLAVTLERYAEDPAAVKRLATILHYLPDQLQQDMKAVYKYIRYLEELNEVDD